MPELSTNNNKLDPQEKEKGKKGSPTSSECQVASITLSDNDREASPRTVEVQISTAAADNQSEQKPQDEDDTMGRAKRGRSLSPKSRKRTGSRTNRTTRKVTREYELGKQRTQEENTGKEAEKEKMHAQDQEKKKMIREKPHRDKASEEKRKKEEEQREGNRPGNLRAEIERTQKELTRDLKLFRDKKRKQKNEGEDRRERRTST